MDTSEYVSCTGIYKKICAAIYGSAPCVLVVGGPGCGKSSFTRSLLLERGFNLADVSDIYDKEAVSKRVKSFCGTGGLETILSTFTSSKKAVWLDDNLVMGPVALAAALPFGVPVFATSSAKQLAKHPGFRKKSQILKMNFPSKAKCVEFMRKRFPSTDTSLVSSVVEGVSSSIPRALMAIEQTGISDHIEDRRKMDMGVYEIAESVIKIAKTYDDVRTMTSCEPVMLSIILQEMSPRAIALKTCNDFLGFGVHDMAEISCFSGYLYARRKAKAVFPRCYSIASSKACINRKVDDFCSKRDLVPWSNAFMYV